MLQHRQDIEGRKRFDPPKVRMATESYRKKNDVYRQFVAELSEVHDVTDKFTAHVGELDTEVKGLDALNGSLAGAAHLACIFRVCFHERFPDLPQKSGVILGNEQTRTGLDGNDRRERADRK